MLQKLRIQNYAIIDELLIKFSGRLNAVTGETGAGKSILMGALDLVLGKRADSAVLKNKEKKCVVEAFFSVKENEGVKDFFLANDLDHEEEIWIRREIAANGKSRSFVNDTPVNLSQLKELGTFLADLHRQFETQEISTENFQRRVLDALAGNATLCTELKEIFYKYSITKNEWESLKQQQLNADKEADYNTFLLEEFTEINLQENELEMLDAELKLLSNSEQIKQQLSAVYNPLTEDEIPIAQTLKSFTQKLTSLSEYHPDIEVLGQRLLSAQLEIRDIAQELQRIDDGISYDAERIEAVNERLSAGYKLLKKHGVTATAQLLEIQNTLQEKTDAIFNIGQQIEKKEKEVVKLFSEAKAVADKISINRTAQVKPFTQKVNALLAQIGMPNAQIKAEIKPAELSENGNDDIVFLFDANLPAGKDVKNHRFEPLQKVASGGELSRLMLCVKSLVAKKLQLPVLIFDEIDTGISGEAAKQVGIIMKELSDSHQLITITHQPQIAAKANSHYFVYKHIINEAVQTAVKLLDNDERIITIAKMLSGEKPTAAALENAKEMMN